MRRILDRIYDAAGYLAAFFLVMVLVAVTTGIAGRTFGFYVRGTDAYAGYAMAAAAFLALAHTLKKGEHIRVELLLQHVGVRASRALELWALAIATLLAGLFAVYSVKLVWESYAFGVVSTEIDATPLWLPQIPMALGTVILFVAFVDEIILEVRGQRKRRRDDASPLHTE